MEGIRQVSWQTKVVFWGFIALSFLLGLFGITILREDVPHIYWEYTLGSNSLAVTLTLGAFYLAIGIVALLAISSGILCLLRKSEGLTIARITLWLGILFAPVVMLCVFLVSLFFFLPYQSDEFFPFFYARSVLLVSFCGFLWQKYKVGAVFLAITLAAYGFAFYHYEESFYRLLIESILSFAMFFLLYFFMHSKELVALCNK